MKHDCRNTREMIETQLYKSANTPQPNNKPVTNSNLNAMHYNPKEKILTNYNVKFLKIY